MNITNSLCSTDYDPSQQEFSLNQHQLYVLLLNEVSERRLLSEKKHWKFSQYYDALHVTNQETYILILNSLLPKLLTPECKLYYLMGILRMSDMKMNWFNVGREYFASF